VRIYKKHFALCGKIAVAAAPYIRFVRIVRDLHTLIQGFQKCAVAIDFPILRDMRSDLEALSSAGRASVFVVCHSVFLLRLETEQGIPAP
jgi:hypothetical protein